MKRQRVEPQPGQESVWDYPRPPVVEPATRRVRVVHLGVTVAESARALRVLETSHPPTYYLPAEDVRTDLLAATSRTSACEFKGQSVYWDLAIEGEVVRAAAWSYPEPTGDFLALRDHLAFYPGRVDACWLDDERVRAQEGDFYGGWITADVVGPFKGGPGTWGW